MLFGTTPYNPHWLLRMKAKCLYLIEWMQQDADVIRWHTAATSNDRDGMLVDISDVEGRLDFKLEDPHLGTIAVNIPLDALK